MEKGGRLWVGKEKLYQLQRNILLKKKRKIEAIKKKVKIR
ncbi:hypothetical protein H477_3865 [[Clostridium] sordellii ATCC 9714]|nr:hypothetical protein H477_3865 [[Clostridium] sordellii ATCC 9714] [Paeniclostridium sordellii ATCC 9714]